MGATATKSAKFEMTVNMPVVMDIRYVDVWPDKNGYGSQVSVKGAVHGETVTIYLKGKTWANLKALQAGGVIGAYDKSVEEPSEKVNLPVLHGHGVTLTRQQGPKDKYATLVVDHPGAPLAQSRAPAPEFGELPGMDDDDLPPPVDEAYEPATVSNVAAPGNAKLESLFRLYDACLEHAHTCYCDDIEEKPNGQAIAAMAATLFIAAKDRGIVL